MISRKPSIYIYTNQAEPSFLREICAGIEEEGLFFEVSERKDLDLDHLAWQAAEDSLLGSGVGIAGVDIALQMLRLPLGKNLMFYHMPTFAECRQLGANSARAIKKLSLRGV